MNLSPLWYYSAIAVRTILVLVLMVIGLRLFGKRAVGGMNLVDLLLVLLLGNAVQNAITNGSGDLLVGLVAAGVLLLVDRWVGILFVRHPILESRFFGKPVILASDGKLNLLAMRHEQVSQDEVITAVHEQGLSDLSEVRLAMLEDDGSISIIPREHNPE
jgi:uncharacterized membrane protein YcaP (DUF421 family)